mmetsp:Transcript_8917/g.25188  ORF Transcript_8917/g.25188 Transcript_8917/m.25188 type:complete len:238 (-) Transcript_8917:173-886(-)
MTAEAGVLVASPLLDALAAAERAIRATMPAPCDNELHAAEVRLRALLSDVLARLGGGLKHDGRGAKAVDSTPEKPVCRKGPMSNSPDALDEWYTDPWASTNNSTCCSRGQVTVASGESPPSETFPQNLVEIFSLEQLDDTQTEVASQAGALPNLESLRDMEDDRGRDAHWQYGRCVTAKLVALSPPGSSTFEQLLLVLMTIFGLPEQQRRLVLAARPKVTVGRCCSFGGRSYRALPE